jgi:hypothetical protein
MLAKFNCQLPVKLLPMADDAALPGFLDLATGHFVSDRAAQMMNVSGPPGGSSQTVVKPVLKGWGISYSWSARRWLPAGWVEVAPDGLHYAYPEVVGPSSDRSNPITNAEVSLHVVDVGALSDRVISTGPGWAVLDYGSDGIYLTKTRYYSGESNNGLWKMDPASGSTRQLLSETAHTFILGGGAAWGMDYGIAPTTVYRYDLISGSREVWYYRKDWTTQYVAVDAAGRPLVGVLTKDQPTEFWLLSGPNQGTLIRSGDGPWYGSDGPRDSHGNWLTAQPGGLWLLQPNGHLIHVTSADVLPLGDCR